MTTALMNTLKPDTVHRVHNFNPGPSTLPLDVLKVAHAELLNFQGTGMSILEISHRSKEYEAVNNAAVSLTRELLGLDESFHVIFVGGGASLQFAMLPQNFLRSDRTAAYVDTGAWSNKAVKEAKLFGSVNVVASSKEQQYRFIPKLSDFKVPTDSAYVHMTSNNTIFGTQWHWWPETGSVPLICDMSSDFMSRRCDFRKFSLIYAGAQKNIGPSGATMVIIRDDFLKTIKDGNPTMLDYRTHIKNNSLYNTPPVFAVYIVKLVLEWIKEHGGLAAIEAVNDQKQKLIYGVMDERPDFYRGTVEKDSRSWMNITLRLPNESLEEQFLKETKAAGFIGLKGHRDVGGIRVSLYNAMTLDGTEQLATFMRKWGK